MASDTVHSEAPIHSACPTCAELAQPSSVATETTSATAARCLSLATRVCDQVAELSVAIQGYRALEHFVTPLYADENQASVPAARIELTGLLRSLNAQVLQHMHALDLGVTVLRAQLSDGGVARVR